MSRLIVIGFFALLTLVSCKDFEPTDEPLSARLYMEDIRIKENVIQSYYDSIEREMRKDLGVTEANLNERIQQFIEEGHIAKPLVAYITDKEVRWEEVNYATYKKITALRRANLAAYSDIPAKYRDDIKADSIRANLLKLMKPKVEE